MAIARIKNWVPLEVLTAADLNGEINNVINAGVALISPLTGNLDFNFKQATNMRLEVQTATQTAAQGAGRIYWQSSEGAVHVDTGTLIARTPAITALQEGFVVGTANTSGISGATTFTMFRVATDNLTFSGGTLSAAAQTGPYSVRGVVGTVAAALTYTLSSCAVAQLWNPSTAATKVFTSVASKTIDLGLVGPAANGRDQSAAFSANSFVHLYYIGSANGGAIDATASATGPPTGPALPAGYTLWAYVTTVRLNAGANLLASVTRGNTQAYASQFAVLTSGTASTETAVDLSSAVPSQATNALLYINGRQTVLSTSGIVAATIRLTSGSFTGFASLELSIDSGSLDSNSMQQRVPNVGQNIYYSWGSTGGTPQLDIKVQGYEVPNS